jgi:hypothetical protein
VFCLWLELNESFDRKARRSIPKVHKLQTTRARPKSDTAKERHGERATRRKSDKDEANTNLTTPNEQSRKVYSNLTQANEWATTVVWYGTR